MAGSAYDQIQKLEQQVASLQGERDQLVTERQELQEQVARINSTNASQSEEIRDRNTEIRRLTAQIGELNPRIEAKDRRIEELTQQVETLEQQVTALRDKDPLTVAQEEIEAGKQTAAAEKARLDAAQQAEIDRRTALEQDTEARKLSMTRKIQKWGGALAPLVMLLVMSVIGLIKKEVPQTHLLIGIPIVATILAILSPYIMNVIESIAPHASRNWRVITHGLAGALGVTFSSLGILEHQPTLVIFAVWLGCALGFSVIFSALIEAFHVIFKGPEDKRKYATLAVSAVIVSLISAAFYRPIGASWGLAPSYIVNIFIDTVGLGFIGFIGLIGMIFKAFCEDLVKSIRLNSKKSSTLEKGAKLVLVICSIFVSIYVGYGYSKSYDELTVMAVFGSIGSGLGIALVLLLIEGTAIWVVYSQDFGLFRKILVMIVAAGMVSVVAYVTWGSVYYTNSAAYRFEEAKRTVQQSMNGYLDAVESNCRVLADSESDPEIKKTYIEPITKLKVERDRLSSAHNRIQIESAFETFRHTASQTSICLSHADRKADEKGEGPLKKVVMPPNPGPMALSAQYWRHKDIQGVSIDEGSASGATVYAISFDYMLLIYLALVLIITAFTKKKVVEVDRQGAIVSILLSGDEPEIPKDKTWVIINLGPEKGIQAEDALNAHDEKGKPVGTLKVVKLMGNGAAMCEVTSKFEPKVSQVVSLL